MRTIVLTAWMLAAAAWAETNSVPSADDMARAQFEMGARLLNEQKYLSAADAFERATQAAPRFFEAHVNWGIALAQLGKESTAPVIRMRRFQDAAEKFSRAVELNARAKLPYLFWSETLALIGDLPIEPKTKLSCYLGAADKCRQAAEIDPKDWEIYNRWGVLLSTKLVDYSPDDAARRQIFGEAAGLFEKAAATARFSSEFGPVYANWGGALVDVARLTTNSIEKRATLQLAVEKFDQSARAMATAAATYTQWGVALTDMGRLTGMRTDLRLAIEKFKTSLRYRPGDANTLYHLACAHALCGDELLAAQTLKQCLAAATSDEYRNRARTNEDFKALHGNAELRDVFDVPGQWRPEPVKPLSR